MDDLRTPEEITKVIGELEKIWLKYPQLRLGQLISNSLYMRSPTAKHQTAAVDLFYLEDKSLIEKLSMFDVKVSEKRL